MLYRIFDVIFAIGGLILTFPILCFVCLVSLIDTGSPLFLQTRVGQFKRPFRLIKIRTMSKDTASVPSHLVNPRSVTKWGRILRRTKVDELPQLWNVLIGDMSIVGPRPCLFSQSELIELRELYGVLKVKPGITGMAQLQKIDMSKPKQLVAIDRMMVCNMSLLMYMKCVFRTIYGKGFGDNIKNQDE